MELQRSTELVIAVAVAGSARGARLFGLTRRRLQGLGFGVLAAVSLTVAALGAWVHHELSRRSALEAENEALRSRLSTMDERIRGVGETLESMKALDARLRAMTAVSSPDAGAGIGPVGVQGPPVATTDGEAELLAARTQVGGTLLAADLERRIARAEVEARETLDGVAGLSALLHGQLSRLASTPSRRPTSGPVSSGFGVREDPFTGRGQVHSGMDFSPDRGTAVIATGDAVVLFAGRNPTFGNLVELDHGHGITTLYAHLAGLRVAEGARVRRGDVVGTVGNTGRSTGPHLHYEVRLRGVPQDPARFLLD